MGISQNGFYSIHPDEDGSFKVICNMATDGGGWTVFQKRQDGNVDFYRGWKDYKNGFGNMADEFWLGLDKINRLTRNKSRELRINWKILKGRRNMPNTQCL